RFYATWCAVDSAFDALPTTVIDALSLHDALPISISNGPSLDTMGSPPLPRRMYIGPRWLRVNGISRPISSASHGATIAMLGTARDRKSTRLNSSLVSISYAVFCLKKKRHPDPTCD